MSFTGDADTIRFKTILASVLEKNELNGKSAYALFFATKHSDSGWSFGIPQYDLSTGEGRGLFKDILLNAKNGANNIIDDGDPTTDRLHDRMVAHLASEANKKGGTSLTPLEQGKINQALSSTYGKSAIDGALDGTLQDRINVANRVIGLVSGNDKTFLQSDLGKLFLCDFANQYGIKSYYKLNGTTDDDAKFEKYLLGMPVTLEGRSVPKQGALGVDDLLAFYFRTKQARQTPWDPMRRFANVVAAAPNDYKPDLDEAKGVLRAYTYLYVRNENLLTSNQNYINSVNAFRNSVTKPADDMIIANWQTSWGPAPTGSYDDMLMGDDNANYNGSGDYQLNGRSGNDIIFGFGGNDHIEGGKGNDTLIGGTGHDSYIYTIGDGNDTIIDEDKDGEIIVFNPNGTEKERRVLSNFYKNGQNEWKLADGSTIRITHNSPWTITLEDGSTITLGEDFESGDFGITLNDTPEEFETPNTIFMGTYPNTEDTAYNDRIVGDDRNNVITIDQGSDWALGYGGTDLLNAHDDGGYRVAGDVILEGGLGNDLLFGGPGDDRLFAGSYGEMEDLVEAGETAENIMVWGDALGGGDGDDFLYGSNASDRMTGDKGNDLIVGGGKASAERIAYSREKMDKAKPEGSILSANKLFLTTDYLKNYNGSYFTTGPF